MLAIIIGIYFIRENRFIFILCLKRVLVLYVLSQIDFIETLRIVSIYSPYSVQYTFTMASISIWWRLQMRQARCIWLHIANSKSSVSQAWITKNTFVTNLTTFSESVYLCETPLFSVTANKPCLLFNVIQWTWRNIKEGKNNEINLNQ